MKEFNFKDLIINMTDTDFNKIEMYNREWLHLDMLTDYYNEENAKKQHDIEKAIQDIIYKYVEYVTAPTYYIIQYDIVVNEYKSIYFNIPKTQTVRDTVKYYSYEDAERAVKNAKNNSETVLLYDIIKYEGQKVLQLR